MIHYFLLTLRKSAVPAQFKRPRPLFDAYEISFELGEIRRNPEYINGLVDSLLSLKRIEVFLNKKEYNPKELVKNTNPNPNEKLAIEIDGLDFGILKKREEFQKADDELEYEIKENEDNESKEINNKKKIKKNSVNSINSEEKEIELKDLELKIYENEKDDKKIQLLSKLNKSDSACRSLPGAVMLIIDY